MPPKRKSDTETPSSKPNSRAAPSKSLSSVAESKKPETASADEPNSSKRIRYVKEDPGMTAKQFADSAKEIEIALGKSGELAKLIAEPATFSTGSYGWKANTKIRVKVTVDGQEKEVAVQVGVNMTVSGSKPDHPIKKVTNGKRGRPRKVAEEED